MKEGVDFIAIPLSEEELSEWMDKYKEGISKWSTEVQRSLWPPELREKAKEKYYS